MAVQIKSHKWFRWHDAGDLQSVQHLNNIISVCKLTPGTMHWLPTREAQILKEFTPDMIPTNLIIRLSSHMINQGPVKQWPHTSTVTDGEGRTCPAPDQGGICGSCRSCWDRTETQRMYVMANTKYRREIHNIHNAWCLENGYPLRPYVPLPGRPKITSSQAQMRKRPSLQPRVQASSLKPQAPRS